LLCEFRARIVDDAGGRMILVCQGGSRAERCQRVLAAAGLAGTTVLEAGMNAWAAAGAPIARGIRWPRSPTPASWACC
jgi:rhodanese-related sulfurtransferase